MEVICCENCGSQIPPDVPATSVKISIDEPPLPWLRKIGPRGWICPRCTANLPHLSARTHLYDGRIRAHRSVDAPAPCEGCGRVVALRTDIRRTRVTCSASCLVRVSPSRQARTITSATVTECQDCGKPMASATPGARYCSSRCRQRAYRVRKSSSAVTDD